MEIEKIYSKQNSKTISEYMKMNVLLVEYSKYSLYKTTKSSPTNLQNALSVYDYLTFSTKKKMYLLLVVLLEQL